MTEFINGLPAAVAHLVIEHGVEYGEAVRYYRAQQVAHLLIAHRLGRAEAVQLVAEAAAFSLVVDGAGPG